MNSNAIKTGFRFRSSFKKVVVGNAGVGGKQNERGNSLKAGDYEWVRVRVQPHGQHPL